MTRKEVLKKEIEERISFTESTLDGVEKGIVWHMKKPKEESILLLKWELSMLERELKLLQIKPHMIYTLKYLSHFVDGEDVFYQAICEEESIEAIRKLLQILGDLHD